MNYNNCNLLLLSGWKTTQQSHGPSSNLRWPRRGCSSNPPGSRRGDIFHNLLFFSSRAPSRWASPPSCWGTTKLKWRRGPCSSTGATCSMLYGWTRTRFFNKEKLQCIKGKIPGALFHLDYWQGGTGPGHRPLSNGHGAKCHNNRYQVGNTKKDNNQGPSTMHAKCSIVFHLMPKNDLFGAFAWCGVLIRL